MQEEVLQKHIERKNQIRSNPKIVATNTHTTHSVTQSGKA